jgi:anti-sigma B factor antagonist
MDLTGRTDGTGVLVVALREDNLDASNVQAFKDTMHALVQAHHKVVLDMDGVKFIDSSGLGALISYLRQQTARQGDLRLCNLSGTVQALFELMRMQRVFKTHPSIDDAVRSYA